MRTGVRKSRSFAGWVAVKQGDVTEGISLLRSGSSTYQRHRGGNVERHHTALLAKAYEIAGQVDDAVSQLDEALRIVERTGERWLAGGAEPAQRPAAAAARASEAAEELYRKALSIAQEQGARLWELRAAASLARLRRDQGRHVEARELLEPVYGWFTEGFDTGDLKEAKALLDELA